MCFINSKLVVKFPDSQLLSWIEWTIGQTLLLLQTKKRKKKKKKEETLQKHLEKEDNPLTLAVFAFIVKPSTVLDFLFSLWRIPIISTTVIHHTFKQFNILKSIVLEMAVYWFQRSCVVCWCCCECHSKSTNS